MKMNKDELISKINGLEIDDNIKIELMEDVTDSVEVASEVDNTELEELRTKYEELKPKYEELKTKYKERFLKGDEVEKETEVVEEVEEDEEEPRKYEDLFDEKGELK